MLPLSGMNGKLRDGRGGLEELFYADLEGLIYFKITLNNGLPVYA